MWSFPKLSWGKETKTKPLAVIIKQDICICHLLQTEMFPFRHLHNNTLSPILGHFFIFSLTFLHSKPFFFKYLYVMRQNVALKRKNTTVRNEIKFNQPLQTCGHKAFWQKNKTVFFLKLQWCSTFYRTQFIMPYEGMIYIASSNNMFIVTESCVDATRDRVQIKLILSLS